MLRKRKRLFKKEDMQKRGEKPIWNKIQPPAPPPPKNNVIKNRLWSLGDKLRIKISLYN